MAVVLGPQVGPRVLSQWNKFAATVQQQVRMFVLQLPVESAANARAVREVVTWQTGVLPNPCVDFSTGSPRAISHAIKRDSYDLLIHAGPAEDGDADDQPVNRIRFDTQFDNEAQVSFCTPGLAIGLAAQVMRFDGIILWLCEDPATAAADPTVQLLSALTEKIAIPK